MHTAPVNDAWFDDVVELEDDQAVSQIRVKPINVRCHAQRIHPVAIRLLFSALFQILQSLEVCQR